MLKKIGWTIVVAVCAVGVILAAKAYIQHSRQFPSTDNAYIQANVVKVAAEVGGRVAEVPISDQAAVAEDETLFRIDRRPYELAAERAHAQLALARQDVAAQRAAVEVAEAEVDERQAELKQARQEAQRVRRLYRQGSASESALDRLDSELERAQAALRLAQAHLEQAQRQLGEPGEENQRIREARTALEEARLDLEHTAIKAPCRGKVADLSLQAGDMVQRGRPQFALVCDDRYWVYANYKETELERIRTGQNVEIRVDMYPQHAFHGVVQNVGAASGAAFSLLPPQNASGNWVKVTRRVPVRILVTDPSEAFPLRVETSAEVTIDTGSKSEPAGLSFREMNRTARPLAGMDFNGSDS